MGTHSGGRQALVGGLTNTSSLWQHVWHPVALSEEVTDEPRQFWVAGGPWVLLRLDGQLVGFVDRCPHRLAPMSAGRVVEVEDGTSRLACAYHGWRYRADGRCDAIPALGKTENISKRAALASAAGVDEAYGLVWLAPNAPLQPIPAFPEWTEAAPTDRVAATVVRTPVGAAQLVDNFLDAAHFPFVHADSFGVDEGDTALDSGDVRTEGQVVTATFTTPYRDGGEVHEHRVTKTAGPSGTVHLRLDLPSVTVGILLGCLPERADSSRVFKMMTRTDLVGDADRREGFVKEEDQILSEDLSILERYTSMELPLDVRAELHTRSDRLSLAWRQVLAAAVADLPPTAPAPW
jgi:phenylpropionate dioxygenase-like ring-hydroxylating dioxygenase large terminal subunit